MVTSSQPHVACADLEGLDQDTRASGCDSERDGGEDGNIMVEYIVYEENYKTRYTAKCWTTYHICCRFDKQDVS